MFFVRECLLSLNRSMFLLLPLSQAHSRPATVFIDELDAGDLKGSLQFLPSFF
jgi:hypothetical protein